MITVYYTGAKTPNEPQLNPKYSLGGYVSNSPVPSGRLNNLFENTTYYDIASGQLTACKAIVLKNIGADELSNVKIGIEKTEANPDYIVELAFVSLVNGGMEGIASPKDLPYTATFMEANITNDVDGSLALPAIPAGGMLGVWVKRTLQNPVVELETLDTNAISPSRLFKFKISY